MQNYMGSFADVFHLMVNTPGALRWRSFGYEGLFACLEAAGRAQNSDPPSQLFLSSSSSSASSSASLWYLVTSLLTVYGSF